MFDVSTRSGARDLRARSGDRAGRTAWRAERGAAGSCGARGRSRTRRGVRAGTGATRQGALSVDGARSSVTETRCGLAGVFYRHGDCCSGASARSFWEVNTGRVDGRDLSTGRGEANTKLMGASLNLTRNKMALFGSRDTSFSTGREIPGRNDQRRYREASPRTGAPGASHRIASVTALPESRGAPHPQGVRTTRTRPTRESSTQSSAVSIARGTRRTRDSR